jgi:hypothetical protein
MIAFMTRQNILESHYDLTILNATRKADEIRRWNASRTSQPNGSSITYTVNH